MKPNFFVALKRFTLTLATAAIALPASFLVGSAVVVSTVGITAPSAEAIGTVRQTSRQTARRTSRRTTARHTAVTPYRGPATVHGTARRTSRRTARRVTRRHMYTLPAGYRAVTYGAHRYYYYGGLYYYPYYVEGRTVYIHVDVNSSGQPLPPPPVEQMTVVVEVDD